MTANLSSPILKSALSMRTGPLRQLCQTYAIQLKSALPMQTGPSTPNMRDGVNDLNPPCLHGQGRGMNAKELRNAILKSALPTRAGPRQTKYTNLNLPYPYGQGPVLEAYGISMPDKT